MHIKVRSGLFKHLFLLRISVQRVAMLVSKTFVVIFSLCCVNWCLSKPTSENELTEGRGLLSSIWGWITYPFSWWNSGEIEQPMTEQLVGSTTNNPNDIVDIRSHNVTIWCNDQTCTTMKCDKTQCRNITCNLYDTNLQGECKEYNIITDSEENIVPKSTDTSQKVYIPSKPTETPNITSVDVVIKNSHEKDNPKIDERPLELEEVLSSTVNKLTVEKHSESKDPTIS